MPMLEAPVARPIARMMGNNVELADGELRALAFMVAMIGAGVLCAVFSTGTPLSLAIGGTLGYFGMRLLRWAQRVIEDRTSEICTPRPSSSASFLANRGRFPSSAI